MHFFRKKDVESPQFINLKNNSKVTNSKCYDFASSTSNFEKDHKYLAPTEIFFASPAVFG